MTVFAMFNLPIVGVRLGPCPLPEPPLTPTAHGHHCAACNRPVVDFTRGTQADLDAARAASPDGRLCGRFRPEQLAPDAPRPLKRWRLKTRQFLVALVLVCGLGLTSEQAWAQVRRTAGCLPSPTELALKTPEEMNPALLAVDTARRSTHHAEQVYGTVAEQMPVFKGGQDALLRFIGENLRWPADVPGVEGRVFVGFWIDTVGAVQDVRLLKGIHPAFDAEALRVVRLLNGHFAPGRQNGRPVSVRYTIPVSFVKNPPQPAKGKRRKP